jgi:iron complex outermembrane receptor protein
MKGIFYTLTGIALIISRVVVVEDVFAQEEQSRHSESKEGRDVTQPESSPAEKRPPADTGQDLKLNEVIVSSAPLPQTLFESAQQVSVLSGDELVVKSQGTLGDTLGSEAGVASSSFGPGSARPVIRGLGGDRIRVLENGVGTQDISSVSPDHAVTIESSLVDRIEVLRGPAALLYGTSAVGGVVNVFDRRIAEKLPDGPVSGAVEVRGQSVDTGRAGLFTLDVPVGNVVFHLDGFKRRTDDIDIPGYARTPALRASQPLDYPEPKGKLPWSDTDTDNLTLGTSYLFDSSVIGKGFVGAAVSDYNTNYGVPNGEEDISVDAQRRRVDVRGGVRETGGFIESGTARIGITDYDHTEFEGGEAGTKFKQDSFEGRLDLRHAALGSVTGTWGAQLQSASFQALGAEAFQPPTDSTTYSLFAMEETDLSDTVTFQLGGRYDFADLSTDGFNSEASDDVNRNFDSFSQSSGVVWEFVPDYSLALNLAHTERAPNGQELFANGPHVATGAFEIGDAELGLERSLGTDLTLRKNEGMLRGSIGGFYNHFWNYIALNPTGTSEDDLPVYQFEAVNADFIGVESQVALYAIDEPGHTWSFDLQPDYVWAQDRDNNDPLPRMTPFRVKVGTTVARRDVGRARFEVQQVFSQERVADFETSTDGFTMVNLYLSKEVAIADKKVEFFLRGTNLLNEKARNHVSFIKDVAPMPGASALLGMKVFF